MIRQVSIFQSLDSTNCQMKRMYEQGLEIENHVVVAAFQTAGQGQKGSYWHSFEGLNLLFSLGISAKHILPASQFVISKAVAVALFNSIRLITGIDDVHIKWPNDIYVHRQKICGILISNILNGNELQYSIIGIGLNVNERVFPDSLPNPTSLSLLKQQDFDLKTVLDTVLAEIDRQLLLTHDEKTTSSIHQNYFEKLYQLNEPHHYRFQQQKITAVIRGINEFGQLMIVDQDGNELTCDVKELVYL